MKRLPIGILAILFSFINANAQGERTRMKIGEVSAKDFEPRSYVIDTSASAVVLAHIGEAYYEGNTLGYLSVVYKKQLRIRLLKRNGFDAATIAIPLLEAGSSEERLDKLTAVTYNLVEGKVEATSLNRKSVFKDRIAKSLVANKFTMPNLQEGCIVDVEYTVISPFSHAIEPWSFQGAYPVLWSEYSVSVPELFDFVALPQGYLPYALREQKQSTGIFNIVNVEGVSLGLSRETAGLPSDRGEIKYTAKVNTTTLAMENVPALKPEPFTTTIENHIAKISFQLSRITPPGGFPRNVNNTWYKLAADLMRDPYFGEELSSATWLKDEAKKIAGGATGIDAAKKIFNYFKQNFTCRYPVGLYKSALFKKTYQNKNGNVADINLLLTAMLLQHGFKADPVILSTRENGVMYDLYPMLDKVNYVISRLMIDSSAYLLDATCKNLGFGSLPLACYNGNARVVSERPVIINLSPERRLEQKYSNIIIISKDGQFEGSVSTAMGEHDSYSTREKLASQSKEDFLKEMRQAANTSIITRVDFEQLEDCDQPLVLKYDFEMDAKADVIYLNPLLAEATNDNPFKAAERSYPVEMPYAFNEVISGLIEIPEGYYVDEVPESSQVTLNDDQGMFEYLFAQQGNMLQVRSVIRMNKTVFLPEDYATLREFFAYIVKCHSEQIVFKKIKK